MREQLGMFEAPAPTASDLRALTLWQPWAWGAARGGKRVENRPWAPWRSTVGQLVAIHAAARVNAADEALAAAWILERTGLVVPGDLPRGVIVAVARVTGYVTTSRDPWWMGPYGWQLADVVALPRPVPCRGMQGLWLVPAGACAEIRRQLIEVSHA